jgi:hypothetical protein
VEDHSDCKLKFYNCGQSFKHVLKGIIESRVKIEDEEPKWYRKSNPVRTVTLAVAHNKCYSNNNSSGHIIIAAVFTNIAFIYYNG